MVIYTAITGNYDEVRESVHSDCEMVCFIDQECHKNSCWEFRQIPKEADPCRQARRLKLMPHLSFDDLTVWVDGAIRLEKPLTEEICDEMLGEADIAIYRHPNRRCLFEEALACLQFDKDDPEVIVAQRDRYRKAGMPRNLGLVATGFIIRRNTQKMIDFGEMWWSEVKSGSKRDQLSFDYCRWRTGLHVQYIPGSIFASDLVTCFYHDRTGPIR